MRLGTGKLGARAGASLAFLAVILASVIFASASPQNSRLAGMVLDPSGRGISGATLTITNATTGFSRTAKTGNSGSYEFSDLPAGAYRVKILYSRFAPYLNEIALSKPGLTELDVTLQLAVQRDSVNVTAPSSAVYSPLAATQAPVDAADRIRSRNAAELLGNLPGVTLRESGQLAASPVLDGMEGERVRVLVDGMSISSPCPNHMNPPLSFINPSHVARAEVLAGITPVSLGGDSIGGTISVDSAPPVFAAAGQGTRADGEVSAFVRGNGLGYGLSLEGSVANEHFSFGYAGSWNNTDDYTDGRGHVVRSTYAQTVHNAVTLAAQGAGNLLVLQAGLQNTPYEGFPNQQMDLTQDRSEFVNVRYQRDLGLKVIDARFYWQDFRHAMDIGRNKSTYPMPMWMPMDTHGRDLGYSVKVGIPLSERHTAQVGSEFHRFVLDDSWPAVPGKAPMMGPDTFVSINDGHRSRLAWFAELADKWTSRWSTLVGIRNDTVWMNTGTVSGYSSMYAIDANMFNSLLRNRVDFGLDLTALARYEPNRRLTIEAGYARKTRAPSLYERYAWSTNWMASEMVNWYGDGNSYVGNLDLRPEVAHIVRGTVGLHDRAHKKWEMKAALFQNYIRDDIDVDELATRMRGGSTYSKLLFANHDARILGADLDGSMTLWNGVRYGQGEITGVAEWLHGRRLDAGTGLFEMMPLNGSFGFTEKFKAWSVGSDVQLVDRKADVDPLRFEPRTPGYALLNFNAGYQWRRFRIDVGGNNLLNRWYYLPLGGVNLDDVQASGWTSQAKPLTGPGRSFYLGLTVRL